MPISNDTKGTANEVSPSRSPDSDSKDVRDKEQDEVSYTSWVVNWLVVVNVIFLLAGIAMISMELWIIFSPTSSSKTFNEATSAGHGNLKIILSMGIACVKIIMAIWGLLGVRTRNRTIITLFATLLTIDIIVRILLLVLVSVSCANAQEVTAAAVKKSFYLYGKQNSTKGAKFTEVVEKFNEDHMCCNWDSDNTVNLYLDTAWYEENNGRNSSASATSPQTLPESCCTLFAKAQPQSCVRVDDIDIALKNGLIRGNCLSIVVQEIRKILYIIVVAHALMLILDGITVFAVSKFMQLYSLIEDSFSSESD